jgi:hypothetical protein
MERDEFDVRFITIEEFVEKLSKQLEITNELLYLLVKDTRGGFPKGDEKRFMSSISGLAKKDCEICQQRYKMHNEACERHDTLEKIQPPPCDNCKLKEYKDES